MHYKLSFDEIQTLKARIINELDAITPDSTPHIIFACAEGDHEETRLITVGCPGWHMEVGQSIQMSSLKGAIDHLTNLPEDENDQ